jgi:hypothetical protein
MAAPEDEPGKGVGPTHELADAMSRTARRLQEEHGDVEGTLQAVTAAAVQVVPHAEECSISYVIGRSKVEPRASTSDLPRELDALQERLAQGRAWTRCGSRRSCGSTTWQPRTAGRSSPGRRPSGASAA